MKLPAGSRTPFLQQTLHLIAQPTKFLDTCAQRYFIYHGCLMSHPYMQQYCTLD